MTRQYDRILNEGLEEGAIPRYRSVKLDAEAANAAARFVFRVSELPGSDLVQRAAAKGLLRSDLIDQLRMVVTLNDQMMGTGFFFHP